MIVPALGVMLMGGGLIGGVLLGFLPGAMAGYRMAYSKVPSSRTERLLWTYGTGLVVWGIAAVPYGVLSLFLSFDLYAFDAEFDGGQAVVFGTAWEYVVMTYLWLHVIASIAVPVVGETYVARAVQQQKNASAAVASKE